MQQRTLLIAVVLGVVFLGAACESAYEADYPPAAEATPLPEFSLLDSDGKAFTNGDLEGKVALINFWATWCGPCKIEMPWFVEFQRKYKDRGFTVLAVSLDEEGWEVVRPFAEKFEFNFPVVVGDDAVAEEFGSIYALPTTLIVDRSGNIRRHHEGLKPKATYEIEIEALLSGVFSDRFEMYCSFC